MAQATPRQLSYLKSLANRAGQTFTYPKTAAQASAEINRLKNTRPSSRTERRVEHKLIADQIQAGPLDAARVREHEISGRGSSATWVQNREQEPPAPEDPAPAATRRQAPKVGPRTELARYRTLPVRGSCMASGWTGSSGSRIAPRRPVGAPTWSSEASRPSPSSTP